MTAANDGRASRVSHGARWVSPAQLAAYSMALQLPPPAGFKHPLLRYPVGCGFTQRVGYPFSAAPAQIWTNTPRPWLMPDGHSDAGAMHAARVPCSAAAHGRGAADAVCVDAGMSASSLAGGPGILPQIAEEASEDEWHGTELGGWGMSKGYHNADAPCRAAAAADEAAWGAQHGADSLPPSTAAVPCALEGTKSSVPGAADKQVESQAVDGSTEEQLQVAGGGSLAGPAPLDADGASQQCRSALQPAAVLRATQEAAGPAAADQQKFTAVLIPLRGAHRPVAARVLRRPELLYSAVGEVDDAAAGLLPGDAGGERPAAEGEQESKDEAMKRGRGDMDIDMFSWINDREIVRKDVGGWAGVAASQGDSLGEGAPGHRRGRPMEGPDGGGRQAPCVDSWADGPLGDALPLTGTACGDVEEVQQRRTTRPQTLPRLEALHMGNHHDMGAGVALQLSSLKQTVSPNRPRLSDAAVLPPTGALPTRADSACAPSPTALGLHACVARQHE